MEEELKQFETEITKNILLFVTLPNFEDNKTALLTGTTEIRERIGNLRTLAKVIKMASKHEQFREEDAIIPELAFFLWLFEGLYVDSIDVFCFLLITNGHDLFDPIRRRYAHS